MSTMAKTEANRQNALKSTGPKTPAGKAVVARNAVKHGLLSREVLLFTEDRGAFRTMATALWNEFQPVGTLEGLLVDRIIALTWRLRRVHVIETDILESDDFVSRRVSLGTRFIQDCHGANSVEKLSRYEVFIERSLFRAIAELERLQVRRSASAAQSRAGLGQDLGTDCACE